MLLKSLILIYFSLLSSLQGSNHVFNKDTFTDAQWRLEVKSSSPGKLHICVQEGKDTLFDYELSLNHLCDYKTSTCTLTHDLGEGFHFSYLGKDGTNLKAHIDAQANITVLPNGSRILNTGFSWGKSWGFKTSGAWKNSSDSLIGFFNLVTEVKEFHNFGILQASTGHFAHSYTFNKGIFHLGLKPDQAGVDLYGDYANYFKSQATPRFQEGITENYGVILADRGVGVRRTNFKNYGYSQLKFLDLEDAPLELEQESSVQSNLEVPRSTVHVIKEITGRTPRIHVGSQSSLFMGSTSPHNLTVYDWTINGFMQTLRDSEFSPIQTWNNQGQVFSHGNIILRNKKCPQSIGTILSKGAIQSTIEEALGEPETNGIYKKARFGSLKQNQVIIDVLHHLDRYLNTITNYYQVDQRGNRRFTHKTETGFQFQSRKTTRTQKTIPCPPVPPEFQNRLNHMGNFHRDNDVRLSHLAEAMRKIGRLNSGQSGLLGVLLQSLRDAGLSGEDIQAVIDDADIGESLSSLSQLDHLSSSDLQEYLSNNSALSRFYSAAHRTGLTVLNWAKRSGPEFIGHLCDIATLLNQRGIKHPYVVGASTACNLGKISQGAQTAFKKADTFFSKKHDSGGRGNTSHSGSSIRTINPSKTESPIWNGFPSYKKEIKFNGQNGSKRQYYEWDKRHDDIEAYNHIGDHIGSMDPISGKIYKAPKPGRNIKGKL